MNQTWFLGPLSMKYQTLTNIIIVLVVCSSYVIFRVNNLKFGVCNFWLVKNLPFGAFIALVLAASPICFSLAILGLYFNALSFFRS